MTRPEISFSVNKLSQFMENPKQHWIGCKRIMRYLQGTINHGLYFTPGEKLQFTCYTGANWGSDLNDRKLISEYNIYLGGNLVS